LQFCEKENVFSQETCFSIRQVFSLNPSHPFAVTIRTLFEEELRRWDALLDSIRIVLDKRAGAVGAAWIYGSVARGEGTPRLA